MTLSDALHVIARMRECDRRALVAVCPGMSDEAFAVDRFSTDYRFTATAADGEPVAIGGARLSAAGVATLWFVATPKLGEVRTATARFARRLVSGLRGYGVARRVEGHVLADEVVCAKFAAWLGLEFEGCRRKAGANGEDIMIYGKA